MDWTGLLAGGSAFVICLGLVPVARRAGLRIGACDYPGEAKIHTEGISLLGGTAIFSAWLLTVVGMTLARRIDAAILLPFGGGGILAFGLGLLDDVLWKNHPDRYRPSVKLLPRSLPRRSLPCSSSSAAFARHTSLPLRCSFRCWCSTRSGG